MTEAATKPQAPRKSDLRYHVVAVLLLSLVVFYLLDTATEDDVIDITRLLELQAQEYDYFMADVDSIHYTLSGRADYRFRARRVTHYPNPEYSLIEAPRFFIYQDDDRTWQVDSNNGRVEMDREKNQEKLVLEDNVVISGTLEDGSPVNIYTDTLTIYPDEKSMHSESDVLFEARGFSSTSTGFSADLTRNVVRQLADGELHYDR